MFVGFTRADALMIFDGLQSFTSDEEFMEPVSTRIQFVLAKFRWGRALGSLERVHASAVSLR